MSQNEDVSIVGMTHRHAWPRRFVLGGCLVVSTLLLIVLGGIWWRGAEQEARVSELLRHFDEASIIAQYGAYEYEPPPGLQVKPPDSQVKPEEGDLTVVKECGQRIYQFDTVLTIVKGGGQRLQSGVVDDPPRYLEWIVAIFGGHTFARVTDIDLGWTEGFTDADVPLLLVFPDLKVLDISETAITDAGLSKLTALKGLVEFDVSGTNVSAESLRLLSQCKELRELDIRDTKADKQVVDYLKQELPECWILDDVDTSEDE